MVIIGGFTYYIFKIDLSSVIVLILIKNVVLF